MPAIFHPGVPNVYRRIRQENEEPDLRLVRTDIAGFVGYAERGPLSDLKSPQTGVQRITSWVEFLSIYGSFTRTGMLAYTVRAFFENEGRICHVARIAALGQNVPAEERPRKGECIVAGAITWDARILRHTTVVLRAKTEGGWGNDLVAEVTPWPSVSRAKMPKEIAALLDGNRAFTEFSLRVVHRREAAEEGALREEEFYPHLSLDEESDYFAVNRLEKFSNLVDIEIDLPGQKVTDDPLTRLRFKDGQDGLSRVELGDFIGGTDDLRGLRLFEDIDEISILCAPDAVSFPPPKSEPLIPPADPCASPPAKPKPLVPPAETCKRKDAKSTAEDPTGEPPAPESAEIHLAMLDQCERLRDRVAVLDFPPQFRSARVLLSYREQLQSAFGAIYFPWLKVPDALMLGGAVRSVPPCGHVAGTYARLDREVGAHRPPANVALEFVTDVDLEVDDALQQELNPKGINAIRSLAGRGLRVWGARSVARRDQTHFRFIHVRRFLSLLEESIEKSMKWAVFEPNDHNLRATLEHMIEGFLERVWRRGGLKGAQRQEAFYVKCDETNNPASLVDRGQLVCEVRVAIAAPMEFIVFELRPAPSGVELEANEP